MSDPDHPNPRRKARAGVVVVVIVMLLVVIIFVGRNFWHATEVDENAPPSPTQQ